ncbi:hypothetical protein M9H77_35449 [Catharanthus roseus]|uniref:Uncharacterized protein n=1 Tax=Catharanthus roseus TaxID=4058 RepID=A0ACB9ZP13_CATRO|nr:hypothetical protein M9H77_35449 [Catharanthus roseus]
MQSSDTSKHKIITRTLTLVRMGFSYVFINRKAICLAVRTESGHEYFRQKSLSASSPHAYANFTIMPDLYSCMLNHVIFKNLPVNTCLCRLTNMLVYIHACQIINTFLKTLTLEKYKEIPTLCAVGILSVKTHYRWQADGILIVGLFTSVTIIIDSLPSVNIIPVDVPDGFFFPMKMLCTRDYPNTSSSAPRTSQESKRASSSPLRASSSKSLIRSPTLTSHTCLILVMDNVGANKCRVSLGGGFLAARFVEGGVKDDSYWILSPKRGPITRTQRRKLKASEHSGMVAYLEQALKIKLERFEGQETRTKQGNKLEDNLAKTWKESTLPLMVGLPLPLPVAFAGTMLGSMTPTVHDIGFMIFTDGHMPTQSHQEGTSDPTRMNLNETLRSMQQSIEG